MGIFYNKNLKTHKCNLYSTDVNGERMKCRIFCRSFIFISLGLYVISLFYISLWNLYEENIVPSTKYIEIILRNLSENENNNNMKRKNIMNRLNETNERTSNSNNNKVVTLKNKCYDDMSKHLTEKELLDILNSLEECPSKEDLRNIWSHTLTIAKEGLDNILKELKTLIQKYLDNDILERIDIYGKEEFLYDEFWKEHRSGFCRAVVNEEIEYTKNFFRLINGEHTLDDILKFIYSFLEYFEILKKNLQQEYQGELLRRIEQGMNKNYQIL